jgi:hypothetical protein
MKERREAGLKKAHTPQHACKQVDDDRLKENACYLERPTPWNQREDGQSGSLELAVKLQVHVDHAPP